MEQQPVLGTVQQRHEDSGLGMIFTAVLCTAIGVLVGWGLMTWQGSNTAKEQRAKFQKDLATTAEQAWGDGVMWGALAMKNMTDAKEPSNEFGAVMNKAKVLKVQFVAESSKKEGQKVGGDGKVR